MIRCCTICNELRLDGQSRLAEALVDPSAQNAVLCCSAHYAVIPSVGPLATGHALVVTRRHRKSVLRSMVDGQLAELRELLATMFRSGFVRRANAETLLCFEHGTTETSDVELCSTSHAHLHVLPLRSTEVMDVHRALASQREQKRLDLDSLRSAVSRFDEYIACFEFGESFVARKALVLDARGKPSQYMRRLIMGCLGQEDWDWKIHPGTNILRSTVSLGFELNVRDLSINEKREYIPT